MAYPSAANVALVLGVMYSNPSSETPAAGSGFSLETTSTISATYVEDMALYATSPTVASFSYSQTPPNSSVAVVLYK